MEMFKIEHFKTAYPNIEFPEFYSLDDADLPRLQNRLFDKLNIKDRDLLKLTKTLNSLASIISAVNAENEGFYLSSVFSHENIRPNEWVYLNWYRYDQVDKIRFSDLEKYFDD